MLVFLMNCLFGGIVYLGDVFRIFMLQYSANIDTKYHAYFLRIGHDESAYAWQHYIGLLYHQYLIGFA